MIQRSKRSRTSNPWNISPRYSPVTSIPSKSYSFNWHLIPLEFSPTYRSPSSSKYQRRFHPGLTEYEYSPPLGSTFYLHDPVSSFHTQLFSLFFCRDLTILLSTRRTFRNPGQGGRREPPFAGGSSINAARTLGRRWGREF